MSKENISSNLLDQFIFLYIAYEFKKEDKLKAIADKLSKISLSNFEVMRSKLDIEVISMIEELIPDLNRNPSITFQSKNFEIFFSKKRISISFPKNLSSKGRKVVSKGEKKTLLIPRYIKEDKKDIEKISFDDLNQIEDFIKMILISEIMENNLPNLEDLTIIFRIDYTHKPNLENLNQIIKNNFKIKKFKFEGFDFEITENGNKFFFTINPNDESILCSFIYEKSKFSMLETPIEEIVKSSYNKFKEIMEVLEF